MVYVWGKLLFVTSPSFWLSNTSFKDWCSRIVFKSIQTPTQDLKSQFASFVNKTKFIRLIPHTSESQLSRDWLFLICSFCTFNESYHRPCSYCKSHLPSIQNQNRGSDSCENCVNISERNWPGVKREDTPCLLSLWDLCNFVTPLFVLFRRFSKRITLRYVFPLCRLSS